MSELLAATPQQLEDVLNNTSVGPTTSYSLTINYPISNTTFLMLSTSELRDALHSLVISFDSDQLRQCKNSVIDTSRVFFPVLRKFHIVSQPIQSITFLSSNFPKLEELSIEQPSNHPQKLDLDLPHLKLLHMDHIYVTDARKFGSSISRCPKLECFSSYKLWGLGCLREHVIIAPSLVDWEMQRADDLLGLSFWAPSLVGIRFKSCRELQLVHMLEKLPPGDWGPEYQCSGEQSTYHVSFYCVDLPGCHGNLLSSKRCGDISDDMDDFQTF